MIKRIKLHNFQSHKDSELILSENISSIVGLSDSGKSSFLRGLKSVLYRDSFYIRAFETEGYVEVEFDNGTVRREVSYTYPKKCPGCKEKVDLVQKCQCGTAIEPSLVYDRYVVNGEVKEKFGVKLPDFIKQVLKFEETNFVDFEVTLNFFSQHEDMFFIGKSYAGGARNKIMSCLIPDSDKIDILLKKAMSDYQETKILSENLVLDNIVLDNKIKDGKNDAEEIERLTLLVEEKQDELIKLQYKIDILRDYSKKIFKFDQIAKHLKNIQTIGVNLKKISEYVEVKLKPLLEKINRLKEMSNIPKGYDQKIPDLILTSPPFVEYEKVLFQISKLEAAKKFSMMNSEHIVNLLEDKRIIDEKLNRKKQEYNKCLGSALCPVINDKFCDDCVKKLEI